MAHGCDIFVLFPKCFNELGTVRVRSQIDDGTMTSNEENGYIIARIDFCERLGRPLLGLDSWVRLEVDRLEVLSIVGCLYAVS